MKLNLQNSNGANSFCLEIPSSVHLESSQAGELIQAFVIDSQGHRQPIEATVLADRRSLLIGSKVIRIHKSLFVSEDGFYGVTFSNESGVFRQYFSVKKVRPVESKKKPKAAFIGDMVSPMTGKIISVCVTQGQQVQKGDVLLVIEAMKMENRILSQGPGVVSQVRVKEASSVSSGDIILTISELPSP